MDDTQLQFDDMIDFNNNLFENNEVVEINKVENKQRRSASLKRSDKSIYRRAFSETQLLDLITEKFNNGESWHFITGGDVDSLSYLKLVLRQQNLEYCLLSTWCMASEDI